MIWSPWRPGNVCQALLNVMQVFQVAQLWLIDIMF
jgi:hypothetical protein